MTPIKLYIVYNNKGRFFMINAITNISPRMTQLNQKQFSGVPIVRKTQSQELDTPFFIASALITPDVVEESKGTPHYFYGKGDLDDSVVSLDQLQVVSAASGFGDRGKAAKYLECARKSLPANYIPHHVNFDLAGTSARVLTGETHKPGQLGDPLAIAIPDIELFSPLGVVNIDSTGKLIHPRNFEFHYYDTKSTPKNLDLANEPIDLPYSQKIINELKNKIVDIDGVFYAHKVYEVQALLFRDDLSTTRTSRDELLRQDQNAATELDQWLQKKGLKYTGEELRSEEDVSKVGNKVWMRAFSNIGTINFIARFENLKLLLEAIERDELFTGWGTHIEWTILFRDASQRRPRNI